MKKWLTVLLSVLLAAAMMISFAACGDEDKDDDKDEEASVTTAVDEDDDTKTTKDDDKTTKTTAFKEDEDSIIGTWKGDADYSEIFSQACGINVTGVTMDVTLVFESDGTYKIEGDAQSLIDNLLLVIDDIAKAAIEEQDADMTVDDFYAAMGMTKEEFAESMASELGNPVSSGTYEFHGDSIELDGEEYNCTLDGDDLTFILGGAEIKLTRQ